MGEGEGGEALSLFRFHLSLFLPETPDTQARLLGRVAKNILRLRELVTIISKQ